MTQIYALIVFALLSLAVPLDADNQMSATVLKSYGKQAQRDLGWRLVATGHSSIDRNVECKTLGFLGSQRLHLSEARVLFVRETQKLLHQLNRKKLMQGCSSDELYGIKNIGYGVSFGDKSCLYFTEPYIAYVFSVRDTVIYDKFDPVTRKLVTVYEEPYEEAVRIVNGETEDPFPWP